MAANHSIMNRRIKRRFKRAQNRVYRSKDPRIARILGTGSGLFRLNEYGSIEVLNPVALGLPPDLIMGLTANCLPEWIQTEADLITHIKIVVHETRANCPCCQNPEAYEGTFSSVVLEYNPLPPPA